jgi:Na+/proline symporter/CheY-like chemotaxis protein/signal transduction histidine kinase
MNIDAILVFAYLIITLLLGIYWSRNIKDIKDYALGGSNFPTFILAATIIATHASASGFFLDITKSYEDGIYKLLATSGQTIRLLFTAYFIAPRMAEFVGKLSVADIMGDLYGKNIRILSSIPIFLVTAGFVAVQIKVLSSTLEYFTEIGKFECIVLTSVIVVLYSAFGGVRAVTFTDVVQFVTFAIAIPIIFLIVYSHLGLPSNIKNVDLLFEHLFSLDVDKRGYYIVLFAYLVIPSLGPPIVQRLLMAKNTSQMQESYKIASYSLLFFLTLFNILGAMLFVSNPNLESNLVMGYLVDQFTYPGLKGLFLIAIIALAMSTADSNLNAGAVSFSHDFCKPLGLFKNFSELIISKIFSLFIGIFAIFLAINFQDLISLILFVHNFYAPIITVPLLLAIFGFRTSTKAVVVGIVLGISTVIFWDYIRVALGFSKQIDSFIPGMLAHLIGLVFTHFIIDGKFSELSIKKYTTNFSIISSRFLTLQKVKESLVNNIQQSNYLFNSIAVYINILYFISFLYFGKITATEIAILVAIICLSITMVSLNFSFSNSIFNRVFIYYLVCIFSLPFSSVFLFLYSKLSSEIILLLTVSIAIMPVIMSFSLAILGIVIGVILAFITYHTIYDLNALDYSIILNNHLIIFMAIVILMVSVFISRRTFLTYEEIQEVNKKLILDNIKLDQKRIKAEFDSDKVKQLKNEIMNNFSHEIRTPLQKLKSNLEFAENSKSLDDKIISKVMNSFEYLEKYLLRIVELSTYQQNEVNNKIEKVDILRILKNCANIYRKYIDVRVSVEDSYYGNNLNFDKEKINRIFEEIIENSIIHSAAKFIDIKFSKEQVDSRNYIKIVFKDCPSSENQKIYIDENDIDKIFRPFEILGDGKGGYRGLGLSIVKEIVSANGGKIFGELEKYSEDYDMPSLKITILLSLDQNIREEYFNTPDAELNERSLKILLVDDEKEVLDSVSMILEMLGHDVTKIDSGTEAVELIKTGIYFDLLMVDVMMPDMTGIEVLQAVKKDLVEKNIKVVIQSGISSQRDLEKELGDIKLSGICRKPYGIDEIKRMISKVINDISSIAIN